MRTLPQAPNLDYLKQQAKDLLDALRDYDPGATLSDAQRTLARQYGFREWTELKSEVERSRTKLQGFDMQVATNIAKTFDLGKVTEPAHLIETNVMGPWIRLRTDKATWSVHAVMPGFDEEQAEETVRLMDAAGAAGIKTPKAMRSVAGSLLEEVGGHNWRVDEWIDLGPSIVSPVSKATAFNAGEILGTLHGLHLAPKKGMHPWLGAKPRTAAHWQKILEQLEAAEVSWVGALRDAIPSILDIASAHVDPPTDDLVLTHTDFQPPTVHVNKDGTLVPTGWEFAGAITPSWHLGMVLDAWCAKPDEGMNEGVVKPLLEGYASVSGSLPELDLTIFSPVISAWQNWLVSRMNVALSGAPEDRINAEREVQSMLARPHDRSRFEQLLRAADV